MAYTSIFSGGQQGAVNQNLLTYKAPAPIAAKFNVGAVKDVPTLNAALHAGHINQQQWMQRFKQIQATTNGPPVKTGIAAVPSSLGSALNQVFIQSPKAAAVDTANAATQLGKSFTKPTATQAQRDSIINNQAILQKKLGENNTPSFNTRGKQNFNPVTRIANDVVSAYQHLNPFSGVNDANKFIKQSQDKYGFTPGFIKTLQNANTSLSNKALKGGDASGGAVGQSDINNSDTNPNKVRILSNTPNAASSLVHEGLHQVFSNNPQLKKQFDQAYKNTINSDPGLKTYLTEYLKNYKGFGKNTNLNNLNSLPSDLQNEVHSMTAQYYLDIAKPSNNALTQYYNKFLNLSKGYDSQHPNNSTTNQGGVAPTSGGLVKGLKSLPNQIIKGQQPKNIPPQNSSQVIDSKIKTLGHNFFAPGSQATVLAERQNAQGNPKQAISTLNKAIATGKGNTGKAVNVLANVAGIDAGGALGKLGAVKSGLEAAAGRDEGTNALINSQKVVNTNKKINLADTLGNSTVKGATTPKITKVPIEGESTAVAGKVIPKPADTAYIKASNKLSDQYEKELDTVQTVQHPVTQKVLQAKLDTKYNALQQQLDDSYGKSSISFKGAPEIPKPVDGLPRSAADKNPIPQFNSTRISEQEPNKLPPATPAETTSQTEIKTNSGPTQPLEQGTKISGSAINSETRAVEAGLTKEFPDKATYAGTSYKQDAEDAVKLVNENPDKARAIAAGNESGRNQAFNVAVRRAVESKASKESDVDTIMQLGNSSGHTKTSEAAQTLGAESYNTHAHSPVEAIKQIAAVRKEVGAKKLGKSAEKAIASTVKEIKSEPTLQVSRQDWHSFVSDLRCK